MNTKILVKSDKSCLKPIIKLEKKYNMIVEKQKSLLSEYRLAIENIYESGGIAHCTLRRVKSKKQDYCGVYKADKDSICFDTVPIPDKFVNLELGNDFFELEKEMIAVSNRLNNVFHELNNAFFKILDKCTGSKNGFLKTGGNEYYPGKKAMFKINGRIFLFVVTRNEYGAIHWFPLEWEDSDMLIIE